MFCLVYRLLLICYELLTLVLDLHRSLPSLEKLRFLDALSFDDSTLSEFAEGTQASLKHLELCSEGFQEAGNLVCDNIFGHFAWFIEANLNNSLGATKRPTDRIVEDMGKLFVGDGSDLARVQVATFMIVAQLRELALRFMPTDE